MKVTIEEGIRVMQEEGIQELRIYWLEDIADGDEFWWIDVCEDTLDEICEFNWAWDMLSKAEIENGDDYDPNCGTLESDIIVDSKFSESVVKKAIEGWLEKRDLKIGVEIISPDGTVAEKRILDAIESGKDIFEVVT